MAKKQREFIGEAASVDDAVENMYVKARSEGLTVDHNSLPIAGYRVGIAKQNENPTFGEEQSTYDAALTSALGWTRIGREEYTTNPANYETTVNVRGVYQPQPAQKGRPSGAAPVGSGSGRDVTDLF